MHAQISSPPLPDIARAKEQGHIHWHTGKDRFFDRGNAFGSARNLDEEVRPLGPGVKPPDFGDCTWCVVSERGRNFNGHPTVDAIRPVVDRTEQVGGLPEVLDCKLEEESLT